MKLAPGSDTPTVIHHYSRRLTGDDLPALMQLYAEDPMRFLTPSLNLETYGFDGSALSSWGVCDADSHKLKGLLFRLNNTVVAADQDGSCAPEFVKVIDRELGVAGVRGTCEAVSAVRAGLKRYAATDWEDSYLMQLRRTPACPLERRAIARRATIADLDLLAALYSEAGSMYRSRANIASKLADARVFVVQEPELGRRATRIASCALTGLEGASAAIIGGVFTLPAARGKGYATACVSALAADLQRSCRLPVLFYENPVAGTLYRKLGFEECGRWAVLYLGSRQDS